MKFYIFLFFAMAGLAASASDIKISEENIKSQKGFYNSWDIEKWKRKKIENGFLYFQELANQRLPYVMTHDLAKSKIEEQKLRIDVLEARIDATEAKEHVWVALFDMIFAEIYRKGITPKEISNVSVRAMYEKFLEIMLISDEDLKRIKMMEMMNSSPDSFEKKM